MVETTLENLKRRLDLESASTTLTQIPLDFYEKLAGYGHKLTRASASGASEATIRLLDLQKKMISEMVVELLTMRAGKAADQNAMSQLLPEERYVCDAQLTFRRRFDSFVESIASGRPSFIEFAQRAESQRRVTLRFTKRVNELVGMDMRRYGPFEPDDVASIPASSADVLISGGDAIEIHTREET